jgi:hypothetical protein
MMACAKSFFEIFGSIWDHCFISWPYLSFGVDCNRCDEVANVGTGRTYKTHILEVRLRFRCRAVVDLSTFHENKNLVELVVDAVASLIESSCYCLLLFISRLT